MSTTPTYQVVGLNGSNSLRVIKLTVNTSLIGRLNLIPNKIQPIVLQKGTMFTGALQWGNLARQMKPILLNKSSIEYNLRFFYPSNGKIPGSPIPRAGQLLPRPL